MSERDTDFSAGTESSAITDDSPAARPSSARSRAGSEAERRGTCEHPDRKVALLAGIVVAAAIVLAIIAVTVLNA